MTWNWESVVNSSGVDVMPIGITLKHWRSARKNASKTATIIQCFKRKKIRNSPIPILTFHVISS